MDEVLACDQKRRAAETHFQQLQADRKRTSKEIGMKKGKGEDTTKETVAIRRGERVYFFKGTYGKSDGNARQVIRTAVDTIVW